MGTRFSQLLSVADASVSQNFLSDIDETLREKTFHILQTLNASLNLFTVLPDLKPIFPNLKILNLNSNRFSSFPTQFSTLPHLQKLDLSFNKISTIEHSVFSTLLELRLTRNQLRSFPHNINILFPVLHSLSLTQNRIKKCPLLNHPTLTVLDLSRNNISSIDKPLVVPTLTSLSLALNRLTSFVLPNGSHLPCLQILDLRMNYLETLDEQTFESLPTMKSLYLTSNELESLPDRLGDILPNLSTVWVGQNRLKTLPSSFSRLTNPIDIFGGTNELVSCPDFLMRSSGDLRVNIPNNRLRTLPRLSCDVVVFSADSNRITEIGEDVFAWPSRMKSVSLKDNLISSLPKTLFTSTLTCLLLAHNLLTDLPDGLFTLPNLQTLDVSFNSIAIIPPSISQLTSLVKVNFGFNKIKEVPNELFRIPTLTHLILSHNKLASLTTDPAMSPNVELSLGFVDPLSNSMIYEKTGTGTHPGAVLCPLERLLLASNQLTSVPPLVLQFRKLHTLSLAGNGISELPRHFFRSLPNLSRLDLSFNELTHLPESIGSGSTKRISLDVSFNKLTSLPHFLVDSNSLLHSSQLLSLRQRFFGTCTPHTPATPTLASPVALTLDGSGSRPYGFRRGMETPSWQFGHLNVSLNGLGECVGVGGVGSGMESIVSSVLSEWEEEKSEPFALNLPHPSDVVTEPFLLPLLWKNRVYRSLAFLSTCGSLRMDVECEGRMETGLNRPPWSRNTTLRVFHAEFIRCLLRRLGKEKKEEKEENEKEEWEEMVRVSEAEHKRQIVHVGNHIRAFLRSLSDEGPDQTTKKGETAKEEQGKEGEARTPSRSNSPSPHSSIVGGSECTDRRFSGSVLFSDGLSREEQMESLRRVGRTATAAQVSSTELEQTLLSMETESQRMMWSAEFVNPVFATNDFVPIEIEFVGENEGEEAVCEECFPNDPHAVSMCPPVKPDNTPTSSSLPTRSSDLPPSLLTAEEEGREEEEARKNEEEFAVPTIRRKTEIGSVGKRKTSKDDLDLIMKRRKSRNGIQSQHPLITHPITSSAGAMESWEVDLSMEETLGEVSEVSMEGQLVDGKRRTKWSEEEAVLGWGKWSDGVGMDPSLLRPSTHLSTEATKAIVSKVSTEDTVEKEEPAKSDSPIPVLSRKMVFVNNAAGQRRRQDSPDRRNAKLFKEPSTPVYSSLVWKKKWLDETRGMGGEGEGRGKERRGDEDEKGMGGSGVDPTELFFGMSSKIVEPKEESGHSSALPLIKRKQISQKVVKFDFGENEEKREKEERDEKTNTHSSLSKMVKTQETETRTEPTQNETNQDNNEIEEKKKETAQKLDDMWLTIKTDGTTFESNKKPKLTSSLRSKTLKNTPPLSSSHSASSLASSAASLHHPTSISLASSDSNTSTLPTHPTPTRVQSLDIHRVGWCSTIGGRNTMEDTVLLVPLGGWDVSKLIEKGRMDTLRRLLEFPPEYRLTEEGFKGMNESALRALRGEIEVTKWERMRKRVLGGRGCGVFGVFDGHKGRDTSTFLKAHFIPTFLTCAEAVLRERKDQADKQPQHPPNKTQHKHTPQSHSSSSSLYHPFQPNTPLVVATLHRTFEMLAVRIAQLGVPHGSCALVAVTTPDDIFVGHVGDSRAVLLSSWVRGEKRTDKNEHEPTLLSSCSNKNEKQDTLPSLSEHPTLPTSLTPLSSPSLSSSPPSTLPSSPPSTLPSRVFVARPLTTDHKPILRSERDFVWSVGGFLSMERRVNGVLAVSRAFGDREQFPAVCADADVVRVGIKRRAAESVGEIVSADKMDKLDLPRSIFEPPIPFPTCFHHSTRQKCQSPSHSEQDDERERGTSEEKRAEGGEWERHDHMLVLGCDGVFDVLSNEMLARLVQPLVLSERGNGEKLGREAALVIRTAAEVMESTDNVSVIVICL